MIFFNRNANLFTHRWPVWLVSDRDGSKNLSHLITHQNFPSPLPVIKSHSLIGKLTTLSSTTAGSCGEFRNSSAIETLVLRFRFWPKKHKNLYMSNNKACSGTVADPANCIRGALILKFSMFIGGGGNEMPFVPSFSVFRIWNLLSKRRGRPFIDQPLNKQLCLLHSAAEYGYYGVCFRQCIDHV